MSNLEKNKKTGFTLPDNYFVQFRQELEERCREDNKKEQFTIRFNRWVVAASLLFILGFSWGIAQWLSAPALSWGNKTENAFALSDAEYYNIEVEDVFQELEDESVEGEALSERAEEAISELLVADLSYADIIDYEELDNN